MPKWTLCLSSGRLPPSERIEVLDRFQRRAGRADHGLGQFGPGQIACHDQREVADHGRERRQRSMPGHQLGLLSTGHRTRARPPCTPRAARSPRAASGRPRPGSPGGCRPAAARRHGRGRRAGSRPGATSSGAVDVEPVEQALDDPLEAPEVAAGDERQPGRLVGQGRAGARQVDVGDLEQLGVELPVRLVVQAGRQQAGDQALPQGVLALAAGVLDPQRRHGRDRAGAGRSAARRPG